MPQAHPRTISLTRRTFVAGASALLLMGFTACGSTGSQDAAGKSGKMSTAGFPLEVKDAFGTTTIPSQPQRVVTLGFGKDADTAAALGIAPLSVQFARNEPNGLEPWLADALNGKSPKQFDMAEDLPFEQLAALNPDLIIATNYYRLESERDRLIEIAPVVGYEGAANTDSWETTTRRIGQALGDEDKAAALTSSLHQQIARQAEAYPEFKDVTFTFNSFSGGVFHTKNSAEDVVVQGLHEFGFKLSPQVTSLPESGTTGIADLSIENIDAIDADVVLFVFSDDAQREQVEAMPLFQELGAVRRGRYISLTSAESHALAFPSVLSIPYTIKKTLPRVSEALG